MEKLREVWRKFTDARNNTGGDSNPLMPELDAMRSVREEKKRSTQREKSPKSSASQKEVDTTLYRETSSSAEGLASLLGDESSTPSLNAGRSVRTAQSDQKTTQQQETISYTENLKPLLELEATLRDQIKIQQTLYKERSKQMENPVQELNIEVIKLWNEIKSSSDVLRNTGKYNRISKISLEIEGNEEAYGELQEYIKREIDGKCACSDRTTALTNYLGLQRKQTSENEAFFQTFQVKTNTEICSEFKKLQAKHIEDLVEFGNTLQRSSPSSSDDGY